MGLSSKKQGNQFELLFEHSAHRQCYGILRIPDGCKSLGLKKLIRVKTPCDYILAKNGRSILIDTKTQGSGKTFPTANINPNQVISMCAMAEHGMSGYYVVWFRDLNLVVGYGCEILKQATEGLHYEKGLLLGPIENIDLKRLFR